MAALGALSVLCMAVSSYNPYDAVQGFRQVKVAQYVSIALAAVLAFGLAAALGQGIAPLSRVSASIVVGKRVKPRAVERTSRGSLSCSCRAKANQQAMLPETSHLHIVSNKFQDLEMASQLCVISHSKRHCSHGCYDVHRALWHAGMAACGAAMLALQRLAKGFVAVEWNHALND